jgi:hypothetical protein
VLSRSGGKRIKVDDYYLQIYIFRVVCDEMKVSTADSCTSESHRDFNVGGGEK